jgi:hypothetical protein
MVQITPEEVMADRAQKRLAKIAGPKRSAFLYRVWAKDGSLLYIGKAINPVARPAMHRRAPWGQEIDRWTFAAYPTEEETLAAEREAIIREKPKYNKRMTYATRLSEDQIIQMHRALDIAQEQLLKLEGIDPKISKLVIQEAKNRVLRAFRQ